MSVCQVFNSAGQGIKNMWAQHKDDVHQAFNLTKRIIKMTIAVFASAALLLYSPYAFVAGVFIGCFFKAELVNRIDGIVHLWQKNIITKIGLIFAGLLTWPFTLEVMTAWAGARWSVYLLN